MTAAAPPATVIDWQGAARQTCPCCGRSERDKTLGMTVEGGRGVAHCFRCGFVELLRNDRTDRRPGQAMRPVGASKREILSDYGLALWGACRPVSGPAQAYLEARGCAIPPADGDLRWHAELRHPSGYDGPALVALLTDARDASIKRSLHRTWINKDGTKANIDPPRLLLAGHRKAGAVCRLWPDEYVTMGLSIAEGIESALSLAHAFNPVWACIDAGNLESLPVLNGIESLLIAADHDEAGIRAARACATRWAEEGREVSIAMPTGRKTDVNDLARAA